MALPTIAIHGSGVHQPGDIARAIKNNFAAAGSSGEIHAVEFDWDRAVTHPSRSGLGNLYRFLVRTGGNIGATSRLGMEFGIHDVDRVLGGWQSRLHRLVQGLVAALAATLVATPVMELAVLTPAALVGLPTRTFAPMHWTAGAAQWLAIAVGAGVTVLLLLGALRLALTFSPRPGVITIRGVVFLLLHPFLVLVTGALAAEGVVLSGGFAAAAVALLFLAGTGAVVAAGLLFVVLIVLRALWAHRRFGGPIKVMLDIFRYLGEPGYRLRIQTALDGTIEQARARAQEEEHMVLVGHGLGTIIALDSLMHSRAWTGSERVLLVTMGTPLRRWFLTLFPRVLFPEAVEDVVDMTADRVCELRWVNIYRPWDYVGGALGLKPLGGRDVCTDQRHRVLDGHADYWRDVEVRDAFQRGVHQLPAVEGLRMGMKDATHRTPSPPRHRPELRLPSRRGLLVNALAAGVFGGMLWWVATGSGTWPVTPKPAPDMLDDGVVVDAAVTHRRQAVPADRGLTYIHHWEFQFTDPDGAERTLPFERDLSDAFLDIHPPFDERALTARVRSDCAESRRMDVPCRREDVRLRYHPRDLALFDLPDFPPQRFGPYAARGWVEATVVSVALSLLVMIPLVVAFRLFLLFLGQPVKFRT